MNPADARPPRRVFLGLVEIGGYYRNLCEGLRSLGVQCTFVDLSGNPFDYERERQPLGLRLIENVARRKRRARGPGRVALAVVVRLVKVPLFLWAVARFDTFVFGYRSTFFAYRELGLLHRLGKRIVYCFHGSDARPAYLDGSVMAPEWGRSVDDCLAEVQRTRAALARIERYADAVVSHAPYGQFHKRPFVAFLALGIPTRDVRAHPRADTVAGPVRVMHAPSHAAAKGTMEIRAMVARACTEGYDAELVEVTGQPHDRVEAELARADLVFDQLYSDTPMAGVAAEAASAAVPALVAGYEAHPISDDVPIGRLPPTAYCTPSEAYDNLVRLLRNPEQCRRLGATAHHFVTTEWAADEVARRWLQVLDNDLPSDWLVDPADIRYVHGGGIPEGRARQLVTQIADTAGPSALGLDDKPELLRSLLAFARGTPS
jgi:hypothetical protein